MAKVASKNNPRGKLPKADSQVVKKDSYAELENYSVWGMAFFRFALAHIMTVLFAFLVFFLESRWVLHVQANGDDPHEECEDIYAEDCHYQRIMINVYVFKTMMQILSTTLLYVTPGFHRLTARLERYVMKNTLRFLNLPQRDRPSPEILYSQMTHMFLWSVQAVLLLFGLGLPLLRFKFREQIISTLMCRKAVADISVMIVIYMQRDRFRESINAALKDKCDSLAGRHSLIRDTDAESEVFTIKFEDGGRKLALNASRKTFGFDRYQYNSIYLSILEKALRNYGIYFAGDDGELVVVPSVLFYVDSVDPFKKKLQHIEQCLRENSRVVEALRRKINAVTGSNAWEVKLDEHRGEFRFYFSVSKNADVNVGKIIDAEIPLIVESCQHYVSLIPLARYQEVLDALASETRYVARQTDGAIQAHMNRQNHLSAGHSYVQAEPVRRQGPKVKTKGVAAPREEKEVVAQAVDCLSFENSGAKPYRPNNDKLFMQPRMSANDIETLENLPRKLGLDKETDIMVYGFIPDDDRIIWSIKVVSLLAFFKMLAKGMGNPGVTYQGPHRMSVIKTRGELGDVRLCSTQLRFMVVGQDFRRHLLLGFNEVRSHDDQYSRLYGEEFDLD